MGIDLYEVVPTLRRQNTKQLTANLFYNYILFHITLSNNTLKSQERALFLNERKNN